MFNHIQWPSAFNLQCDSERDAFANIFKMILKLKENTTKAISARACTKAAVNFIQYINEQKRLMTRSK